MMTQGTEYERHGNLVQPHDDHGKCITVIMIPLNSRATILDEDAHEDGGDTHGTEVTRQLENLFRVHSYELSIKPWNQGLPTNVDVSLMIESITDISEKNMDLTFTLCIHESWRDERLRFDVPSTSHSSSTSIVLPSRLVKKIWVPDIYIVGSKSSFIHTTTVDNIVLRLFNDGRIIYNVKLTTTVACQMDLYNFPLDTENCTLTLQSLGYNSDELVLEWSHSNHMGSLFLNSQLVKNMPKFRLVSHQFHKMNISINERANFGGTSISQLQLNFIFKRYLLSVFFQSYFLAMSMVVLAGLGMWIDPKSVPARVAISVTSVLTLSTIITGLKTSLPKVSYLTAMDVYLWICFLFVFSTVLEFCVFNYIMTQQRKKIKNRRDDSSITSTLERKTSYKNKRWRRTHKQIHIRSAQPTVVTSLREFESEENNNEDNTTSKAKKLLRFQCRILRSSDKIDVIFRTGYFFSFITFNVIYWNYYITMTHLNDDG